MSDEFRAGLRVRLKSNPARMGVLSGNIAGSASMPRWEVIFPDRTEMILAIALEPVPEEGANPFDDMRRLRFVKPRELRSALTHARLGGRLADLVYSLFTTNTDFFAYQFKPLLSFLDSPSRGILIADEVGLGKTIEAGLIWTELRSREDARRLLVMCPAILCDKWQRELADRFGVEAQIVSPKDAVAVLEKAAGNSRAAFALIVSMQAIRGLADAPDDEGTSVASRFHRIAADVVSDGSPLDLVVIDEAHYLRNPSTQTARIGRLLRHMTDNLVLLSATPVHLKSADLFNLLNLVDSDSFPYESSFDRALRENAPLVALRDLMLQGRPDIDAIGQALGALRGSPVAQRSEALQYLLANPPTLEQLNSVHERLVLAERIDRINPITKAVSRTRKREVHERRVVREPIALSAEMSQVEAQFYEDVTSAVRRYCARYEMAEGFLLTIPQRQMCSSMAAACRVWSAQADRETADTDEILWEAFGDDGSGIRPAKSGHTLIGQLARIARDAGSFEALRQHDSKFDALKNNLFTYWKAHPRAKVVLFAYFRETLRYLQERFHELGVDSVVLMGGMDKRPVLERFREDDGPRLLLASEVASEGIDLQFSSLVVNYDLPWNPMRIEQRIGRIDRIGQKADKILILNLFLGGSLDERVYVRLLRRLGIFENALGGIEGVLGEMVREMSYKLLRGELTVEQEVAVIEQTAIAAENTAQLEEKLEKDADQLVAHADYLQQRITLARDMNRYVNAEDLRYYISDFIDEQCPGAQLVETRAGNPSLWALDLGAKTRADFADFLEIERIHGKTRLAATASGRHPCVFDNVLKREASGVEVISQYHPLVAYIGRRLREADRYRTAAVSSMVVPAAEVAGLAPGVYVFAVSRWNMSGEQDREWLVFGAHTLVGGQAIDANDAERLVSRAVMRSESWISAPAELDGDLVGDTFGHVMDALDQRYANFTAQAERENRDRIRFQLQQVDHRANEEIKRLRELVAQLKQQGKTRTIRANEGRIAKVMERAAERRARLAARTELRHEASLVCGGVINVV